MFGPVAVVDVLDDLLAPGRSEVDVDIGVGRAALVDEPFEEQLVANGVDTGDAEGIGDDRIAGTAATLSGDATLATEAHEVPADEEELGQAGALDDIELVGHLLEHPRRHGVIAAADTLVAERLEIGEGGFPAGHGKARKTVSLELQRHLAALGDLHAGVDAVEPGAPYERIRGQPRWQCGQLVTVLERVLTIGPAQVSTRLEIEPVADRHEHVLQFAIRAEGVMGVVGHDRGQPCVRGETCTAGHDPVIVRQQVVLQFDVELALSREEVRQPGEGGGGTCDITGEQTARQLPVATAGQCDETLGVPAQQLMREARYALGAGEMGRADQAAEAGIARLLLGQQGQMRAQLARANLAQVLPAWLTVTRRPLPLQRGPYRFARHGWRRDRCWLMTTATSRGHDDPGHIRRRGIEQLDLDADDRMQPRLPRDGPETYRAIEALMVGGGEAREAQFESTLDEILTR